MKPSILGLPIFSANLFCNKVMEHLGLKRIEDVVCKTKYESTKMSKLLNSLVIIPKADKGRTNTTKKVTRKWKSITK